MTEVCEFQKDTIEAIDGKIAKSSLKWVATIFAFPTVAAILTTWAFIASADYRYGSQLQAEANKAQIALLDERTKNMKMDFDRAQLSIKTDLDEIKKDIKFITMKYRENGK